MKTTLTAIAAAALLSGCVAAPISNEPTVIRQDGIIAGGLRAAAFNLRNAISIGVLPVDDPASVCVEGILKDAGLAEDSPPVLSFEPQVVDLISAASVAYIEAQRLKALQGTLVLPGACEAVIGRLVIEAAKSGVKISPLR
jgi:hypothetical protein